MQLALAFFLQRSFLSIFYFLSLFFSNDIFRSVCFANPYLHAVEAASGDKKSAPFYTLVEKIEKSKHLPKRGAATNYYLLMMWTMYLVTDNLLKIS
jgi:hypothetical protein